MNQIRQIAKLVRAQYNNSRVDLMQVTWRLQDTVCFYLWLPHSTQFRPQAELGKDHSNSQHETWCKLLPIITQHHVMQFIEVTYTWKYRNRSSGRLAGLKSSSIMVMLAYTQAMHTIRLLLLACHAQICIEKAKRTSYSYLTSLRFNQLLRPSSGLVSSFRPEEGQSSWLKRRL